MPGLVFFQAFGTSCAYGFLSNLLMVDCPSESIPPGRSGEEGGEPPPPSFLGCLGLGGAMAWPSQARLGCSSARVVAPSWFSGMGGTLPTN